MRITLLQFLSSSVCLFTMFVCQVSVDAESAFLMTQLAATANQAPIQSCICSLDSVSHVFSHLLFLVSQCLVFVCLLAVFVYQVSVGVASAF